MVWKKVQKDFSDEGERDLFLLLLEESARVSGLLVRRILASDNRNYGQPNPSKYYICYEVAEKIILSKEEIL